MVSISEEAESCDIYKQSGIVSVTVFQPLPTRSRHSPHRKNYLDFSLYPKTFAKATQGQPIMTGWKPIRLSEIQPPVSQNNYTRFPNRQKPDPLNKANEISTDLRDGAKPESYHSETCHSMHFLKSRLKPTKLSPGKLPLNRRKAMEIECLVLFVVLPFVVALIAQTGIEMRKRGER